MVQATAPSATTATTTAPATAVLPVSTDTNTDTVPVPVPVPVVLEVSIVPLVPEGSMDIVTDEVATAISADSKEHSAESSKMEVEVDAEVEAAVVQAEEVPLTDISTANSTQIDVKSESETNLDAVKETDGVAAVVEGGVTKVAVVESTVAVVQEVVVKKKVQEEHDVNAEGGVQVKTEGALGDIKVEEVGSEQHLVEDEPKMEESEAREWRRLFVSACRWFDLDQVSLLPLTLPHLTSPYLTLPYLTLPYLTLLYFTLPFLLSACYVSSISLCFLPFLSLFCLFLL